MAKRLTIQHTERWPVVPPSAVSVQRNRGRGRWDDRDIYTAFMVGALAALALVSVLALILIASMAG